jgi:hypothetical protein
MVGRAPLEGLEAFCREVGGSAERVGGRLVCRFGARRRVRVAAGWLPGGYKGLSLEVGGRGWDFVRRKEAWRFAVRARGGAAVLGTSSVTLLEEEAEGFEAAVSEDPKGRMVFELKLL